MLRYSHYMSRFRLSTRPFRPLLTVPLVPRLDYNKLFLGRRLALVSGLV